MRTLFRTCQSLPVTVEGDVDFGSNVLMCSDSTSIDAVEALGVEEPNGSTLDPPYGNSYQSNENQVS